MTCQPTHHGQHSTFQVGPHRHQHLPAGGVLGCSAHTWLLITAVWSSATPSSGWGCCVATACWASGPDNLHVATAHQRQDKLALLVLRSLRLQPAVTTQAGSAPLLRLAGLHSRTAIIVSPPNTKTRHPACANARPHGSVWLPAETPAPPACSDNPPDKVYTCAQQQQFGKCSIGALPLWRATLSTCLSRGPSVPFVFLGPCWQHS